ncbi:MAG: hypothetical protein RI575_07180 [Balneolaceae bacterium]|nr:hypothetical protein [Balneolaceae bacterium]MDR9407429.1 hypothetical protein [Balneolaceae bacterium]
MKHLLKQKIQPITAKILLSLFFGVMAITASSNLPTENNQSFNLQDSTSKIVKNTCRLIANQSAEYKPDSDESVAVGRAISWDSTSKVLP